MTPYIDEKDVLSPLKTFPIKLMKIYSGNLSDKITIEVGCGNGLETFALAPYFHKWYGIDPSKSMLNDARKIKPKQLTQVRFYEGIAEKLPFASDSVNVVMFTRSFHFINGKDQALAEAYRVLMNDGVMIIVEPGKYFGCDRIRIGSPLFNKKRYDQVILNRKPTNNYIASIGNRSEWQNLYESRENYGNYSIFRKI